MGIKDFCTPLPTIYHEEVWLIELIRIVELIKAFSFHVIFLLRLNSFSCLETYAAFRVCGTFGSLISNELKLLRKSVKSNENVTEQKLTSSVIHCKIL